MLRLGFLATPRLVRVTENLKIHFSGFRVRT
jgi:hypothetical protein